MAILWSKNIKEFVGEVIADQTPKTRTVLVKSVKMHPLYKKRFIVRKKYYVHDEENKSKVGDIVKIRENKPISKLKRRVLIQIQ